MGYVNDELKSQIQFEQLEPRLLLGGGGVAGLIPSGAGESDIGAKAVSLPDLTGRIDASKLPLFVLPGDRKLGTLKKVPVVVTNQGSADAIGAMKITLFASTDQQLRRPRRDTSLGSAVVSVKLKPGKSKAYCLKKVECPALAPGDYYLLAEIDADNDLTELVENNNLAVSSRTIEWQTTHRDLTGVIDTSKVPKSVQYGGGKAGVLKKVPVTVTNAGNVGVFGTFVIDLYASADETLDVGTDTLLGSMTVSAKLKPGRSKSYKFSKIAVPDLPPGAYHLLADIDALNQVSESNELNNLAVSGGTMLWQSAPVVFVLPKALKAACQGEPYYESVASDTNPSGGNGGPYYFTLGTMGGFPPMGIILGLDGVLSGTPTSPPGNYKFTICAIDTAGNSSSKPTSITVDDCTPDSGSVSIRLFPLSAQLAWVDDGPFGSGWVGYWISVSGIASGPVGTSFSPDWDRYDFTLDWTGIDDWNIGGYNPAPFRASGDPASTQFSYEVFRSFSSSDLPKVVTVELGLMYWGPPPTYEQVGASASITLPRP